MSNVILKKPGAGNMRSQEYGGAVTAKPVTAQLFIICEAIRRISPQFNLSSPILRVLS